MIKVFRKNKLVAQKEDYSFWVAKDENFVELINRINNYLRKRLLQIVFEEALYETFELFEQKGLNVIGNM